MTVFATSSRYCLTNSAQTLTDLSVRIAVGFGSESGQNVKCAPERTALIGFDFTEGVRIRVRVRTGWAIGRGRDR